MVRVVTSLIDAMVTIKTSMTPKLILMEKKWEIQNHPDGEKGGKFKTHPDGEKSGKFKTHPDGEKSGKFKSLVKEPRKNCFPIGKLE